MKRIIEAEKSVIVAADVIDLDSLSRLVEGTCEVPGVV